MMVNETVKELMTFLDSAPSVYHAVEQLRRMFEDAGYTRLDEGGRWDLQVGGKYYLTRGGSAIVGFRIPCADPQGFLMTASHSDRPTFKIKENGELDGNYVRIATEKYGGMLMAPWFDRPLSVAGRVMVETEAGVQTKLVNIDRDLMMIPNVAIHMNRKANDGYAYNPTSDTIPVLGGKDAKGRLMALLEEQAGGEILAHDLFLYNRDRAKVWGAQEEFFSAQAIDDLECAWSTVKGFLTAGESRSIPVVCVFDSEEVGSSSVQGAASTLLADTIARICRARDLEPERMLSQSFLISADNAHGIHPNHPELADAANAPVVNGGVVLKFNANLRYTTDGVAAAVFRRVCRLADVPVQTYYNRADIPGGSTLGNISLGQVSVPTADIGLAQLAMHSCYETAGVQDVEHLLKAMQLYYGSTLTVTADGTYLLN